MIWLHYLHVEEAKMKRYFFICHSQEWLQLLKSPKCYPVRQKWSRLQDLRKKCWVSCHDPKIFQKRIQGGSHRNESSQGKGTPVNHTHPSFPQMEKSGNSGEPSWKWSDSQKYFNDGSSGRSQEQHPNKRTRHWPQFRSVLTNQAKEKHWEGKMSPVVQHSRYKKIKYGHGCNTESDICSIP